MSRNDSTLQSITHLGSNHTQYPTQYDPGLLEAFPNLHPDSDTIVTLLCPEFTSLCPKTGQPDFAEIVISYIPDARIVESKSLKLYLFSFRNHGDFHEDCVNIIRDDLVALLAPRYLEVTGLFRPRGGISIHPFAAYATPPYEQLRQQRLQATLADALHRH